ncbi:glycerophosphoryl diester phosphodiesterase [Streptomyces sp. PvR006]|uniref:glycerophosphodiester phosphodiesterase n=1 Tax=Streptomyces sp. PvR006 TaxID=2817860 RepID=UPI001AE5394A|nr:glycerophosphodiester phosphodiesterase family protein [Streptomyces sp. PvR006]MBP2583044.1 glycerophosphoryl diester phosphodiesterase [Streptomyces sp. PvR006]
MSLESDGPSASWADLDNAPAPRWIAHRGGRWMGPENTLDAFRMAVELGIDAIEIDVYRLQDGGLVVMHDSTADRTSNLTGPTSGLTTPAALRGRVDAGGWFCNSWPTDLRIPLFAEVLAEISGQTPLVVHCNNTNSGAAAVEAVQRHERAGAVLIMAWNEAELAPARAAGIPTILLDEDGTLPAGQTYAGLLAAGTQYIGLNPARTPVAAIEAAAAAGLRVIVYTVNRRADLAALPLDSVWAVISDDPWYVRAAGPMRTRDIFSAQTYFHGMLGIVGGQEDRGQFQAPAWFGLDTSGSLHAENLGYLGVMQGYLGPLPEAFTIDFDFALDAADSAGSSLQLTLTTGDAEYDDDVTTGGARRAGYNILVRSSGAVDIFKTYGGTTPATKLGGVVSAALVPGTVYHLRVQVTPGQITATRTTVGAPNSVTVTDASYRGDMYPHLGVRDAKARWGNLIVA